jgi:hypothetical protein
MGFVALHAQVNPDLEMVNLSLPLVSRLDQLFYNFHKKKLKKNGPIEKTLNC